MDQTETITTKEFTVGDREYRRVYTRFSFRQVRLTIALCLCLFVGAFLFDRPSDPLRWAVLGHIISMFVWVLPLCVVVFWLYGLCKRRVSREPKVVRIRLVFDDTGVTCSDDQGREVSRPWEKFAGASIYRDWLMLLPSKRRIVGVPFRAFETGDVEKLRAMLQAKGLLRK
jgi:hypothetical protein